MTTPHDLDIDVTRSDDSHVLSVHGEIDYGTVARLRASLLEAAREDSQLPVVVDLSDVTFIDSTALSVLVQAKQRIQASNRTMRVEGARPRVSRVLELAGLLEYLS